MHRRLNCPNCDARLIDEAEYIRSEVKIVNQTDNWNPDYYTKCWNCKKEIGIKKLIESMNIFMLSFP